MNVGQLKKVLESIKDDDIEVMISDFTDDERNKKIVFLPTRGAAICKNISNQPPETQILIIYHES